MKESVKIYTGICAYMRSFNWVTVQMRQSLKTQEKFGKLKRRNFCNTVEHQLIPSENNGQPEAIIKFEYDNLKKTI